MTTEFSALAQAIGPIYASLDPADHPVFVAFIERSVGNQYRKWANTTSRTSEREQLLGCAMREDQNAKLLDALAEGL